MKHIVLPALAVALAVVTGPALAAPVNYETPEEVAAFTR